jgi:hypothetical protein
VSLYALQHKRKRSVMLINVPKHLAMKVYSVVEIKLRMFLIISLNAS